MVDSLKREKYVNLVDFQQRVNYYFRLKASSVLAESTPNVDDLKLAKAIYANAAGVKDMCRIVVVNTSIGTAIDSGDPIPDTDIEWALVTDVQFHNLAVSYVAAGLI